MKKFKLVLYLILGSLLVLAFYLWQCTCNYSDFGLNFFTELVGIVITVFIVEILFKRIKESENLPLQIAIYNEVNRFTSAQIRFIQEMYRRSIDKAEPDNIEALLNKKLVEDLWDCIDMKATPLVQPRIDMWTHIQREIKNISDKGNEILNRYSGHIDPKVHLLIHDLANSPFITSMHGHLVTIRQFDVQNKIPRPAVLTAYTIEPPQEYFENLLSLYYWTVEFHNKHVNEKSVSLPFKYAHEKDRIKFPYKKDPRILEKEIEEYNLFLQGKR